MLVLDEDQVAARRRPIEDIQISSTKPSHFHCHYCEKNFQNELIFMKHVCLKKKKALEFTSPTGQAAFAFYNDWLAAKKFSKQTSDAFLSSKFYSSFIKFATFIKSTNILKADRYVRIMIEHNLQPPLWCRDEAYKLYLQSLDANEDPIKDVQDTISFLIDICMTEKIVKADGSPDLGNAVSVIGVQRTLNYIRNKSISPWIIFIADSFKAFVRGLDLEHRKILDSLIKTSYWYDKLLNNKEIAKEIKFITTEMGM